MEKEISLQDFYIDHDVDKTRHPVRVVLDRNQIRQECQRDWELLWDKNFIYAGCADGIDSDLYRLIKIIDAAKARIEQYNQRIG